MKKKVITRGRNQLGVNMVGLIIWSVLAVVIMGGVVALFVSTSQQTAIGAEQNQQQQSILNALNRTSRDISVSNPIQYASSTEIVLDVTLEDGAVERRRYELNLEDKKVYEYAKKVTRGDDYNKDIWNSPERKASTVYNVDTDALEVTPFLKYYDDDATVLTGDFSDSGAIENISRVDISLTADVSNKGNVSLSTSAVPRSTSHLGGSATNPLAPCPAFTATRSEGNTVVLRWDRSSGGATSYEVTRNGVTIHSADADASKAKYSYTDNPGASSTVMNYMLKVISPAGISNCISSVAAIVNSATASQLQAELIPATTLDANDDPIATAWSNAEETTKVELEWSKVDTSTGYVIYKQVLDAEGNPTGPRVTVETLEEYPYVDLNSTTKAANNLSLTVDAEWDENIAWSIKVLSRTGDNDNTPEVRTLSYPKPVTDASIIAVPLNEVSAADLSANKGNNKLTWNYTAGPSPLGFDIYRSAIDAPAANFPAGFTKIGTAGVGINEYVDRNAELGSTYGYYVVAKNESGFSNSYASKRVQQLQFPPDPVMLNVGVNGSRDLNDGTNRPRWKLSKSASGYHVFRTDTATGTQSCLTGNCKETTGTLGVASFFDDSSAVIKPATRFRYAVYSYNATGLSPQLAVGVTLTQRPSAPKLTKTASPTLTSRTTSLKWDHTAGAWCVSGKYTAASGSKACQYEQKQFRVNGTLRYTAGQYATTFNWGNQEWGRHYTYSVRARNAAVYNGGWSAVSGKVAADTYPGPIAVNAWNGNKTGANAHRINYESKVEVGGWGSVKQAGYTTLSWGQALGSRVINIARKPDTYQATSKNADLLLPSVSTAYGKLSISGGKISAGKWAYIAAPGTKYRYDLTALAIENNLKRTVSTSNIFTPADIPRQGAVQVVCAGPDNNDPTGLQDHPAQKIATRTAYTNLTARYGYYQRTAVEKLYSPTKTSGVKSAGWVNVQKGASGNGIQTTKNGVGYFKYITNGFNFVNKAPNRTDSATLEEFNVYVVYPFNKCAPAGTKLQEPADACYGITAGGCTALNPDNRPRWLSK